MPKAAILFEVGRPPEVREIVLPELRRDQVKVRIAAAGVCHSDLSMVNGTIAQRVPAILGHEGSGTVTEVGDGVRKVAPGDRVVFNWSPGCGECWYCLNDESHICERAGDASQLPYATLPGEGSELYQALGVGAFAEEAVVSERAVVPLPDAVSLESAAVLGCAVLTGVGAVVNTAGTEPGESVAVFGLGGVGLCAVQGARLAGASPIIAIDASPDKAELALSLGATDFLVASDQVVGEIRALTEGRGVDHAFECVGRAAVMRQAWSSARRGGHATIVGIGSREDTLSLNALELPYLARTLTGSFYGSSNPDRDVPRFARLAADGRISLDALVSRRIGLDGIPAALERLERGEGARSLIVPSS
jgi:S-(hydroxymethyl)glutathione dehydrogenase/alcohol dehydrogenase